MPTRPKRLTPTKPATPTVVTRGTANQRGYDSTWQRESKAYLKANPLCIYCTMIGRTTASTCVDHKKPHKGDRELFWDRDNWAASCKPCNDSKRDRTFEEFVTALQRTAQ